MTACLTGSSLTILFEPFEASLKACSGHPEPADIQAAVLFSECKIVQLSHASCKPHNGLYEASKVLQLGSDLMPG